MFERPADRLCRCIIDFEKTSHQITRSEINRGYTNRDYKEKRTLVLLL